jgi:hypothetical protein
MRTEHAAQASQTIVRFLLSKDEAINPRYAPQGQHGSGSYFSFFLTARFSGALQAAHVAPPAPAHELAPPTAPVPLYSYASCMTHACLATAGK